MTSQGLSHTIALLARTPAALDALLRGLPAEWTHGNEGSGTWSASDIVSHLVHADRTNWMPRVRSIVQADTVAVFEAFDRHAFDAMALPLADRLSEFTRVRAAGLAELRDLQLQPSDLARRGQHPAVGLVTLSQLLATWATHDLTHLHHIARVMAHQYRDEVGPWKPYLGVLHCDGHGTA
jgi:hypothetical protein